MARKPEDRGFYVSPKDPSSPIHCKVSRADGLRPITEAEARALSAAKRAGCARQEIAATVAPADAQAVVDAINSLEARVVATVAQQVQPVEVPDLTGLTEAVQDHERRIGALEQDRETAGDGQSALASDEQTGASAPPPSPDVDYEAQLQTPPVIGDWREAIKRMEDDEMPPEGPAEDFGIGMETYPDDGLEPDPMPQEIQVSEGKPLVAVQMPTVVTGTLPAPPPAAIEPPLVPKTIVVAEQKTISDATWGKAQMRYEIAIQAKNGNTRARALMRGAAARRNISVEELANEILREREEMEQRVMSEF